MRRLRQSGWVIGCVLCAAVMLLTASGVVAVHAAGDDDPPGPDRFAVTVIDKVVHEWWLIGWEDYEVNCSFQVGHEGLPEANEVYDACGVSLYTAWIETMGCPQALVGGDTSSCTGFYLHEYQVLTVQEYIGVPLPPAQVWLSLDHCVYSGLTNRCEQLPTLVLTGEEPISGEIITEIHVIVDGSEYMCGPVCEIDLGPTGSSGMEMSFWAASSYGDTSQVFDALIRVAQQGYTQDGNPIWYVDVISDQWRGGPSAGCAEIWRLFPPVGGPPLWLSTPDESQQLASDLPLDYLAGNLIARGLVNVDACEDEGLLPSGAATECGIDIARPVMTEWQNQFDTLIFDAAQDTGVPAQLLKNLFSRESQFWPGSFRTLDDVGLGQLTENGADTTLLWNQPFFEQFCPYVLDGEACARGYAFLQEEDQALLRGALVANVDAACPECPLGIDLDRAYISIDIFAETLLANCSQAASIVEQTSGVSIPDVSTYEDMWRFTLVNYNAGSGCLSIALNDTIDANEPLQWGYVKTHLTEVCSGAGDYVDDISR